MAKTIEELRKEAAEKAVPKHDNPNSYAYTNEQVELACKGFFTAGAEWEAEREKWIEINKQKPELNKPLYFFRQGRSEFVYEGLALWDELREFRCIDNVWYNDVTHWQYKSKPTPPKTSKQ